MRRRLRARPPRFRPLLLLLLLAGVGTTGCGPPFVREEAHSTRDLVRYAESAWPTLHRDARNSDAVPVFVADRLQPAWTALDGASLLVGPTIGPDGTLYLTTGRGEGESHLHAFSPDGELLWESDPQRSLDDLDSGAVINAVVVDQHGDLYAADIDQLWSFGAEGRLRWVTRLADHGARGHFVTPIITRRGRIGGITTQGQVALFDAASGELALPVLDLPGVPGRAGMPPAPGMFGGGLLDPELIRPMWNLIFGWEIEVANTPAVDPRSGRIFVTAVGATPDEGVLYAIDEGEDALEIAWSAAMTGDSGTSPVLSPDGARVFAAGDEGSTGVMFAFDARDGSEIWRAEGVQAAASPTLDALGQLLSFSRSGIVALDAETGQEVWRSDYNPLAERALPFVEGMGSPIARVDGILTATGSQILAALNFGYKLGVGDQIAIQPTLVRLAVIDPVDGRVRSTTPLRDTSSALIVPGFDGRVHVSLSGISTSLFEFALNAVLPEGQHLERRAVAGLQSFEPASRIDWARAQLGWLRDRALASQAGLAEPLEPRLAGLRRGLAEALRRGELDATQHARIDEALARIRSAGTARATARGLDRVLEALAQARTP